PRYDSRVRVGIRQRRKREHAGSLHGTAAGKGRYSPPEAHPYHSRLRLHDAGALIMRRRSIRFRLTAWYAAVLTAGLGLFGGLIWLSLRSRLIGEVDRDLEGRASRFEQYFRTESAEGAGVQLRDELNEFCQALPPSSYVYLSGSNDFVFRYPTAPPAVQNFRMLRQQFTSGGEVF